MNLNHEMTEKVAQARAEGLTNKEIARKFRISDSTVKQHLVQFLKQKRLDNPDSSTR